MLVFKRLEQIIKSQQGVSLPVIIVAILLVTTSTFYIMDLSKGSKVQFASSRGTSFAEMERRRIGAVFGENTTCKMVSNLGGKPAIGNITALVYPDGKSFLKVGDKYYKNVLTVGSIFTRDNPDPPPVRAARGLVGSKAYELVVIYSSPQLQLTAGRPALVVRIPMYLKLDASSNITDCYAMVGNTNIDTVISSACSPVTSGSYKNSYSNSTSAATVSDCNHDMTFETATSTTCGTVGTTPTQKLFSSFTLASNILSFKYGNCTTGLEGAGSCGLDQVAYNITNSIVACNYPGGSRDGACAAGQILWHSAGNSSTCISVNSCTGTQFIQKVDGTGTSCYTAPDTTCGPNQYVYQFNPTGADQCAILPDWNDKTCAASNFGTKIVRATTTSGGDLICTYYNKTKSCAGSTTFMTGTDAAGAATCLTF